jgi:L-alanine-DL-glutamate epimerase-like enolase superfamily enzyme
VKVAELIAFQVRIPLSKPIRHASHRRTETDNLVVRCVLEDGTVGFGEGVPRDYVTGETITSALSLLKASDLASQRPAPRSFAEALAQIESIRLLPVPDDVRGCQGNAARCALELALLDAYGKHFQEPLSRVTEILAPELFQARSRVQYSGAITSARGFKARLASWMLRLYGFAQVKVKVGIAGQDDPGRLRTIRRRLGQKIDIRVDANEAWTPEEATQRIQELEAFGISSVEQPVRHEQVQALKEVRSRVRVPIMLDESLCSQYDAQRALADGTCDLFNLRLSKCGGFIPSLRLTQFAYQHGLGCQLGCQVGETALLTAAGRHFASSVGGLRYLEGSYDRHLVREALGRKDYSFGWGGWAPALPGPGLGVQLDEQALTRVTVHSQALV